MVRLDFEIALTYDVFAPSHFLFNIGAARTAHQHVEQERIQANVPVVPPMFTEPHFCNRMLRLQSDAGTLQLTYAAIVDIQHTLEDPANIRESSVDTLPPETLPFLLASRYCQSDRLAQFASDEFGSLPPGYSRVEAVRSWVHRRTRFTVGTSNTSTTALDTLTDQRGVCRDFAHLMIALCRALNIPSRFVTGIDYGADPSLGPVDFHAYVEAWLGDRWYLFDATGISPTTGLLRLATGRDAADVSFCTMFGPVKSHAPRVAIRAIADEELGLVMPEHTTLAVSTAGGVCDVRRLRAVPEIPDVMPLPQPIREAAREFA